MSIRFPLSGVANGRLSAARMGTLTARMVRARCWILRNLKIRKPANQRELAEAVGVREATLTHHLNAMDARGLVTRTREAANRRVQVVALTEAGEAAFVRLRDTAMA